MATKKRIRNIRKASLTNAAHMSMNTELYERIMEATPAALKLETLAPLYRKALDTEGVCVNRVTKSAATKPMREKDVERGRMFSFVNAVVSSFLTCPDAELRQAAAEVKAVLSAYIKTPWLSFSEETASVFAFLREMESEKMKAAAETLGITTYLAQLKTLNEEYREMAAARIDEYTARVKIGTGSARKVVDDIWADIARRVNAVAELEPSETVDLFIDTVNQIFRDFKNLIAAKGGSPRAAAKEAATEGAPSEDLS